LSWLGVELVAIEVGFLIIAIPAGRRRLSGVQVPAIFWVNALVSFVSIGLVVVAGASLIAGQGPGLYLVIPAVLVILLVASYFAWTVLFVAKRK